MLCTVRYTHGLRLSKTLYFLQFEARLDKECPTTANSNILRMAPVEIESMFCCDRQMDSMSADESDFFTHREEKLEIRSFRQFGQCHGCGDTDTIIGSERCSCAFQYSVLFNYSHTFCAPVMRMISHTDHVHVGLETEASNQIRPLP